MEGETRSWKGLLDIRWASGGGGRKQEDQSLLEVLAMGSLENFN